MALFKQQIPNIDFFINNCKVSNKKTGAHPFCKHAGPCVIVNALNLPKRGLILNLVRYSASHALDAVIENSKLLVQFEET